ncbi:MAG: metallophosphoesterase family protein [Aggregatilineales bacterium]
MSEPLRILHFADVHIGMENYGSSDPVTGVSSRVTDFLRCIDEMVDYARDNGVDLTVFAGDAFKTRTPNPTFQREFAWRVRDLASMAPLVMVLGNHDMQPSREKASSLEIYSTLAVPNVWIADSYEVRRLETQRGPAVVGSAPYPFRSRLLEDEKTAGITIADTDALLTETLTAVLDALAAEADAHGPIPRLLAGHFSVSGALLGSERGIMLGRDVQVALSAVADPRWDYVALGHIHKYQNLTRGRTDVPPVVYSGSMERIHFGEEGDAKGFCWVELARGAAAWRFVPVKARPLVTLRADLRQSADPTRALLQDIRSRDLKGVIVRVIVQLSAENESQLNESAVRDALRAAGINYLASLQKDVERANRVRLGISPEGLTAEELLERYLLSRDVPAERRAELLALARSIFDGRE